LCAPRDDPKGRPRLVRAFLYLSIYLCIIRVVPVAFLPSIKSYFHQKRNRPVPSHLTLRCPPSPKPVWPCPVHGPSWRGWVHLFLAGHLRITRAPHLHDAQDLCSERRSSRHVVEMQRSTSRARCTLTRPAEGVERRMGARDVAAPCCGVRKTAGCDAPRRSRVAGVGASYVCRPSHLYVCRVGTPRSGTPPAR
jgi:hypothetical protein